MLAPARGSGLVAEVYDDEAGLATEPLPALRLPTTTAVSVCYALALRALSVGVDSARGPCPERSISWRRRADGWWRSICWSTVAAARGFGFSTLLVAVLEQAEAEPSVPPPMMQP